MVSLSQADHKLPKTIETPQSKVNIERATAICLQKKFQKTNCCFLGVSPSHSHSGFNNMYWPTIMAIHNTQLGQNVVTKSNQQDK